ncbi:hypothetical protein PIB30_001629 [Stylosanthes scabra]|uniref:Uncharacterized protein n=1 Tax=Stylosanthes scabra TaxID=79078 RepID=A0ABU6T2H5_9FABA|nr:hypothetical protein [Stylosanthes scabra]
MRCLRSCMIWLLSEPIPPNGRGSGFPGLASQRRWYFSGLRIYRRPSWVGRFGLHPSRRSGPPTLGYVCGCIEIKIDLLWIWLQVLTLFVARVVSVGNSFFILVHHCWFSLEVPTDGANVQNVPSRGFGTSGGTGGFGAVWRFWADVREVRYGFRLSEPNIWNKTDPNFAKKNRTDLERALIGAVGQRFRWRLHLAATSVIKF